MFCLASVMAVFGITELVAAAVCNDVVCLLCAGARARSQQEVIFESEMDPRASTYAAI